jgi:methyl-accepting chemotaxis protein
MTPDTIALWTTFSHWAIGIFLLAALLYFLLWFVRPAWRVGNELQAALRALGEVKGGDGADLGVISDRVMGAPRLRACWEEYRDTLHRQQLIGHNGQLTTRYRATAIANAFFSESILVDTPLRTEFFKHLPGILTGLGIIGTFTGLILGLHGFQVSDDANLVRQSLGTLLHAVGGAFVVSASAILLAMLVTAVEKGFLTRRYADVERLCARIDGLYQSGVGEDYLADLVTASKTSATQAQHIKDALVTDLKSILTELTERQMAGLSLSNQQLGQHISNAVTDTLKAPLEGISDAVKHVANQQGDAVNRLLTDVLASFAGRMESMFGGQLGGMNELLTQTAVTMKGTAQQFEALAARIEQAGTGATEKIAERMESLLTTLSERQAESNAQMTAFVEQMRTMVADGTSQNAELMQGTFSELSDITSQMMLQLQQQTRNASQEMQGSAKALVEDMQSTLEQQQQLASQMAEQHAVRMNGAVDSLNANAEKVAETLERRTVATSDELKTSTREMVATLEAALGRQQALIDQTDAQHNARLQALTESVRTAADTMQQAVTRMRTGVDENITRLGGSAERLDGSASKLASQMLAMAGAAGSVETGISRLTEATQLMAQTAHASHLALGEHKQVRDAIGTMVTELRGIVDRASREASLNEQLVRQLETAAERLVAAQKQADQYLAGISSTLTSAHQAFADSVGSTLQRGNAEFQRELSTAVDMLRSGVQDLADLFDNLPANVR